MYAFLFFRKRLPKRFLTWEEIAEMVNCWSDANEDCLDFDSDITDVHNYVPKHDCE